MKVAGLQFALKPGDGRNQGRGLGNAAGRIADGSVGADDRGIEAAGAEEVHQRRVNIGVRRCRRSTLVASADGEGAGGRSLSRVERVIVGSLEVAGHEVAANRVGIDGAVEMASAVEVVSQAESEAAAEILLQGQVRLLRVGVNKILRLRIAEGLKCQRQKCRRDSDNSG